MEQPMTQTDGGVDFWPFTRLLITAAALGLAAHFYAGWSPDYRYLARLPANIFEILSLCALISFALADLYLLLFLIPLYAVAVLNDWFYDLSVWACEKALGFRCSGRVKLAGLCGEIFLFAAAGLLVRRVIFG